MTTGQERRIASTARRSQPSSRRSVRVRMASGFARRSAAVVLMSRSAPAGPPGRGLPAARFRPGRDRRGRRRGAGVAPSQTARDPAWLKGLGVAIRTVRANVPMFGGVRVDIPRYPDRLPAPPDYEVPVLLRDRERIDVLRP